MKPIRILTPNVDFLGEISNYESLMFTRSWHNIGTLELRINRHKLYTETLQKGNVIVVGNDTHKAYLILHREIELDENGKVTENWVIKAYELKVDTSERLVLPPPHTSHDNKAGSAETVMKHYISNNLINPVDVGRKIPRLSLAPNQNRGPYISYQLRNNNLAEALTGMSLISGIGWGARVDYATREIIYDTYEGRVLSVNQDIHSPIIFSPLFGNIKNMQYVDSDLDYKNVAYVAGQGEGVDRRTIVLGEATGRARREVFVDARDVAEETEDEEPLPRPVNDIIRDLQNRGNQKLAEMSQEMFLEAQIMTPVKNVEINNQTSFITQFQTIETIDVKEKWMSSFVYEIDWDLGDIVTLQNNDWGVTLDTRITEVTEIYERDSGFRLEATFGLSRPTLISKIKQEIAGMKTEITR